MKTITTLGILCALVGPAVAQDIEYRFLGSVSVTFQTELEPPYHLWDASIEVGTPFDLRFRMPLATVDGHTSAQVGDFSPVEARLQVGSYSFSSGAASFSLRDNLGGMPYTDGFGASFTSSESYFGAPFGVHLAMQTADLNFLGSDQLQTFSQKSFAIVDPGSFSEVNFIRVVSDAAQIWLRTDSVSAIAIPEPSVASLALGVLAAGFAVLRKRFQR
jgi:hypothetical protein